MNYLKSFFVGAYLAASIAAFAATGLAAHGGYYEYALNATKINLVDEQPAGDIIADISGNIDRNLAARGGY
jgi:hypothetical protein